MTQHSSYFDLNHVLLRSVAADFIRGVTYSMTNDPLLQKIYEKEGLEEDETPNDLRPVDPRQELFAAIKSRRKG